MISFNIFLILLIAAPSTAWCARTLGIFAVASRSHHSINQPIVRGLASRGHNVTILSAFKNEPKLENYTELLLDLTKLPLYMDTITVDMAEEFNDASNMIHMWETLERSLCNCVISHEYVQRVVKSKEKLVDLIIVESYSSSCFNLIAEKLDVPVVTISPPSMGITTDIMIGNINNPSYVPEVTSTYTTKMNFWQRLRNTIVYGISYYYHYRVEKVDLQEIGEKYLDMGVVPHVDQLEKRVALSFFNNHASFISKPSSPNAINIAGIHIKEAKPLSKEIKDIMDNSKNGVIFFSFGTTIKASSIPVSTLKLFTNVFAKIPQKVLWRVDDPRLIDLPDNVITGKWFPQRDILEHENLKLFISHCGLFGTLEAMHTGVPVIGIPFLFDQQQDANILAEKGMAIHLDYSKLTEELLLDAINKIVNDTRYIQNAKKVSRIFRDRLVPPLDEALYWVEYVLRHNGAPSLRTTGADMPFYQYLLLDVLAVAVVSLTLCLLFLFIMIRRLANFINCRTTTKFKQL